MKKIKYLTPILGLTAMIGAAAPIATACAKAVETKVLPYNLLKIDGVTLKGLVSGTDLTKYDTIEIPEGVKVVDVDAFNKAKEETNEESEGFDYSTIKTLKLPSTLRAINADAFIGLTKLNVIDLTDWNSDTIQYLEVASGSICPEDNMYDKYCKVNIPEGLTIQETQQLKTTLADAGVPYFWYVNQTSGHISVTEGTAKELETLTNDETTIVDAAGIVQQQYALPKNDGKINLTFAEPFDTTKYTLEIYPQITSSNAACDGIALTSYTPTMLGVKECTIKPAMYNCNPAEEKAKGYYPMLECENHAINYDLNVVCYKNSTGEIVWNEKLEGFKLANTYAHVTGVAIDNKPETGVYETWLDPNPLKQWYVEGIDPTVTITPSDSVIKTVSWENDDALVLGTGKDEDGKNWVQARNQGSANLIVKTDDSTQVSDSVKINVVGTELELADNGTESTLGTYFGHEEAAAEPYSYGYILRPGTVAQYHVKLDGTKLKDNLAKPHTDDPTKARSFGIYNEEYVAGVYKPVAVECISGAELILTRNGVSTTLTPGTHYDFKAGKIYLNDKSADPEVLSLITFQADDELTFKFTLTNTESLLYTGFGFAILA